MTKIILASELLEAGVNKTQIAARLGVSWRTVIRWFQGIAEHGSLEAFLAHNQQAITGPRQLSPKAFGLNYRACNAL